MNLSYIKLDAKDRLVNNNFKGFIAAVLPFASAAFLASADYCLYTALLKPQLEIYLKAALLTAAIVASFIIQSLCKLISECFFFSKSRNPDASFKFALKRLKLRRVFTMCTVSVLKFFLSLSWSALYYSPCAAVSAVLAHSFSDGSGKNVKASLAASALLLFLIGTAFLFVTLKRYSACTAVILEGGDDDAIGVIEKSISVMDGNTLRYARYCLSFTGWILSCALIAPVFYVLPYRKMAKYSFYDNMTKARYFKHTSEKPIIFYLSKEF